MEGNNANISANELKKNGAMLHDEPVLSSVMFCDKKVGGVGNSPLRCLSVAVFHLEFSSCVMIKSLN